MKRKFNPYCQLINMRDKNAATLNREIQDVLADNELLPALWKKYQGNWRAKIEICLMGLRTDTKWQRDHFFSYVLKLTEHTSARSTLGTKLSQSNDPNVHAALASHLDTLAWKWDVLDKIVQKLIHSSDANIQTAVASNLRYFSPLRNDEIATKIADSSNFEAQMQLPWQLEHLSSVQMRDIIGMKLAESSDSGVRAILIGHLKPLSPKVRDKIGLKLAENDEGNVQSSLLHNLKFFSPNVAHQIVTKFFESDKPGLQVELADNLKYIPAKRRYAIAMKIAESGNPEAQSKLLSNLACLPINQRNAISLKNAESEDFDVRNSLMNMLWGSRGNPGHISPAVRLKIGRKLIDSGNAKVQTKLTENLHCASRGAVRDGIGISLAEGNNAPVHAMLRTRLSEFSPKGRRAIKGIFLGKDSTNSQPSPKAERVEP